MARESRFQSVQELRDWLQDLPGDVWEKLRILHEQVNKFDDYECEWLFDQLRTAREAERLAALPRLTCCGNGHRFVIATCDQDPNRTPWWCLDLRSVESYFNRGMSRSRDTEDIPISVCPFCTKPLPALRLKDPPPAHVVNSDDYYCLTCGERLHGCYCDDVESRWEVVPVRANQSEQEKP